MIRYLLILLLLAGVVYSDDDIGYDTASSAVSNATTDGRIDNLTYCLVAACGVSGDIDSIQFYVNGYTYASKQKYWVMTKENSGSWVFRDSCAGFTVATNGNKHWETGATTVGYTLTGDEDSCRICAQAWADNGGNEPVASGWKNTSYSLRYDYESGQSRTAETDVSSITYSRSANTHAYAARFWYSTSSGDDRVAPYLHSPVPSGIIHDVDGSSDVHKP